MAKRSTKVAHKYEYDIDLGSDVAPARVLRMVGAGKKVLEIGAGPGSITRHLSGTLGCDVVALEIDPEALEKLKPFARSVYNLDLNDATWHQKIEELEGKFDVVIAADVLEHVYDPWKVLGGMKALLNDTGSVILSVPHVGHSAIAACLLDEDFQYGPWGLLDRTHVRFFGIKNMQELVRSQGLEIEQAEYVVRTPQMTEFAHRWAKLPEDVRHALECNRFSHVYQVVSKSVPRERAVNKVDLMSTEVTPPEKDVTSYWEATMSSISPGPNNDSRSTIRADNFLTLLRGDIQRESTRANEAERKSAGLDVLLAEAMHDVAKMRDVISQRNQELASYTTRIGDMKRSWTWRITSPFRELGRVLRRVWNSSLATNAAATWRYPTRSERRKAYRRTKLSGSSLGRPLQTKRKSRTRANIRAILRHPLSSQARRAYREDRQSPNTLTAWNPNVLARHGEPDGLLFRDYARNAVTPLSQGEYVSERRQQVAACPDGVKLIAYYLPQFHPIPENDEWWGKGFTEWRNVARAFPVFQGHYQPRMPGELGYYDLRVSEVMRRQVELARQYGISAFCFHFYWFGGKRLLEMPIEQFLLNEELDLEFSLCWANENWSRRWDGGNNELLIAQEHSAEDDIAFIRYLDRYFRNRRYMKIDGKPVLTVYRPGIIPDIQATIERWRREAEKIGYPGLYLIATNSFGFTDYATYGFDALSEFPPHAIQADQIQGRLEMASTRTGGNVYSYDSLVDWEISKQRPAGVVHPGVMPSWDNSARRPNDGHIFQGAKPELFGRWLRNSIKYAARHAKSERLVFINAWNEWAEGAYLEPDARYGYAWLEEVRVSSNVASTKLAIVIHAFYEDILQEILVSINPLSNDCKLFVTTNKEIESEVRKHLEGSGREFLLRVVENRGRDVLPFLRIYPDVRAEGFQFIAKVHTKRSPHRKDGGAWRNEIINTILDGAAVDRALSSFIADPTIGMIGPRGHCVPMSGYFGENRDRVLSIGARLGLGEEEIVSQPFFAGTMFMARAEAFEPLVGLDFDDAEFESESGQKDGTLAHALERAMALSVKAAGMRLASCDDPGEEIAPEEHYRFAARSK